MADEFVSRVVIVKNREGLHARPAYMLAKLANEFQSRIEIVKGGEPIDGKSILSILTLAAEQGTELWIRALGPDAEFAADAIVKLFDSEFANTSEPIPNPNANEQT